MKVESRLQDVYLLIMLLCTLFMGQAIANQPQSQQLKMEEIPKGLSANDWSSIRQQINAGKYRAFPSKNGGFVSSNSAHGWQVRYTENGAMTLTPRDSDATAYHLGMKLSAVGYSDNFLELKNPQLVSANDSTVTYQWNDNIKEWWINSEKGLEQWFRIKSRPKSSSNTQALMLKITLDANIKVSLKENSLKFDSPVGRSITYNKLKAWDANGKAIPARMTLAINTLSLLVDDVNAIYPITIDPSFQQQSALHASNYSLHDSFGSSVSIDGNTVVVGAPWEDSNAIGVNGDQSDNSASNSGAVYVFVRVADTWNQQAYLKASNTEAEDGFGYSVAISGETIVVGAWLEKSIATGVNGDEDNDSSSIRGAAYVFVRTGSTWNQQAYLKSSNTRGKIFGSAVAISGETIVIGDSGETSIATGINNPVEGSSYKNDSGAAYVFVRTGNTWSEQAYLKASNTDAGDEFARSVSIDKNTIVVGAYAEDSNATGINGDQTDNSAFGAGAAYVFVRNTENWSQQAYIKASNTDSRDIFGYSVDISGDTIVIDAPQEASKAIGINGDEADNSSPNSGAIYIFNRTGGTWAQQAYIKPTGIGYGGFFRSKLVSISGDIVLIPGELVLDTGEWTYKTSDVIFIFFRNSSDIWSQLAYLKTPVIRFIKDIDFDGQSLLYGVEEFGGTPETVYVSNFTNILKRIDFTNYLLGNSAKNSLSVSSTGFGVNSITGNFFHQTSDASMPGKAIPFTFSRSYNKLSDNKDSFGNPLIQPLGSNWTHSYNIQLAFNAANNQAEVIWGDGQREGFNKNGTTWSATSPGNFSVLTVVPSGWQVETQSHLRYLFDSNGRLTAIKRAYDTGSGDHVMLFDHNANDELIAITDTAGRIVELKYDANHRLTEMNLPGPTNNCHGTGKRTIKYFYTADGRLRNVKDMNCVDHFYTYSQSTMQVHWADALEASLGNKSSMKLKVTFDAEGRVSQQKTGQNLTTNNGKYLFTWGNKTLTYQTPTGADNAVFNWDDQRRVTSTTRAGKTKSITYGVAEGPESLLPKVINDYENHDFTPTFANADLTELKLPDNRKQTMAYTHHDLSSMTTENGLNLVIGRNAAGKATSLAANGTNINANHKPAYTLAYAPGDLLNRIESATLNGTKTEVVSHHVDGQPLEIRQYLDATHFISTQYTYDAAGRRTSTKDQRGTLSCFYYDDEGNLTDSVRGLTGASCPASPPNASVTVRRTHREYDAENRLIKIVQGFGSSKAYEKSYQYNATTGDLARTCGPSGGRCIELHYDLDSKVEWSTRPDTRKDRFYELASGRIQITRENADKVNNAFDRIVRTEYDGNGQLITESSCVNMQQAEESTSDCAAHSVRKHIIRDSIGRPTQIQLITDVANNTKRVFNYSYSANGLVTTVSGPEGQLTVSTRDATGNLISVVEKNGTQTLTATYEYDGDGRLIKTTSPEGLITVYSYDGLGRKISKTDLSGTTTWIYDDTAGTVRSRFSDGTYIDVSTNRLGQVTSKTSSDGINISYTYDALGRLDVESWSGSGGTGSRDYDYTVYNEIDKITGPFGKVVDYSWDNVNRLTKVAFDTYSIDTLYNGLDEVRKMVTPAGNFEFGLDDYTGALLRTTYPTTSGLETIFKRNSLGELTRLTTKKGSTVITDYDISLDGLGRRSSIASEQPLAPGFGNKNLSLLLKTSGANKGLIDKINGTVVGYDGRGNITALPVSNPVSMTYDGLNRLIQVGTTQHKYDAGRNRIETLRSGKTTRYLLDTSGALPDVLANMDDQNKVEKLYIHGPGGLLAEVKNDGTTRFVHQDFNHNVVALTDSSGSLVSSYAYTPFGDNAGVSGDGNFPFRFAGGVGTMTDPEGIMYMRARYYHPGIQQFTSSDLVPGSLGRPQSLHRYAYVEGMALGGVDPSGLLTFSTNTGDIGNGFEPSWVHPSLAEEGRSGTSPWEKFKTSYKNMQKQVVADLEKMQSEHSSKANRKKYKVRHRTISKSKQVDVSKNTYSPNKVLLFFSSLLPEVGSGVAGEVIGEVDPTGITATALTDPNALPASMALPLIITNTENLQCIAMVTSKGLDPSKFCQKSTKRHKKATDWFKKGLRTID